MDKIGIILLIKRNLLQGILVRLLLIIFFLLFPSVVFGDWTRVADGKYYKTEVYMDFDRIRKHNGKYFWWTLINLSQIGKDGVKSLKGYREGDCKLFRLKGLSYNFYKEPMSGGTAEVFTPTGKSADWEYPPPNSAQEYTLKIVCNQ